MTRALVLALFAGCWWGSSPVEPRVASLAAIDAGVDVAPRRQAAAVDAAVPDVLVDDASVPSDAASGLPSCKYRILKIDVDGANTVVTAGVGSNSGVTKQWQARLLDATRTPGTIRRVADRTTVIDFKLTPDQIAANPYVCLAP